ncbi:hypothetical protein [uncultured Enterococcus sp.]|uniref:hypothetical protein n=1 Tax=uncultured Enterococcus sp. TaxID=167972 RepID=UPI002AA6E8AA|nr:hypothetical protein [uncultured Enterococcus sp.]
MIYRILNAIVEKIESNSDYYNTISSGENFESLVLEVAKSTELQNIILNAEDNGKHAFPDVRIQTIEGKWYGLEVKFSNSGHWNSLGNSIFESVKSKEEKEFDYEDIFLIFGRKPAKKEEVKNLEAKFDLYTNILKKIEVTHSPRFSIDMNLSNNSVFSDSNLSYYQFRQKSNAEKVSFLKDYFKKNITENRWYTQEEQDTEVSPALINEMDKSNRNKLMAEGFILFPNDLFSESSTKYHKLAKYYMNEYFAFSSSLRDMFSASGRMEFGSNNFSYSKVVYHFYRLRGDIESVLLEENEEFIKICQKYWSDIPYFSYNEDETLEINYLMLLIEISNNIVVDSNFFGKNNTKMISLDKVFLNQV